MKLGRFEVAPACVERVVVQHYSLPSAAASPVGYARCMRRSKISHRISTQLVGRRVARRQSLLGLTSRHKCNRIQKPVVREVHVLESLLKGELNWKLSLHRY